MRRALVTRPQEQAEATARRLESLGVRALVAPVLRIAPTGDAPPAGPFEALVITSRHALCALPALDDAVKARPVFAVGGRTAEAARAAGLPDVRSAEGDALGLAALIRQELPGPARLLQIGGRDRKPEPAASLHDAGYALRLWEVYAAEPVAALPTPVTAALRDGTLDLALHFSRRSVAIALELAAEAGLAHAFLRLDQFCLSADVAEPLRRAGARRLHVAPRPDEDALLDLLGASSFADGSPSGGRLC